MLELRLCNNREGTSSKLLIKDAFKLFRNTTTPKKEQSLKDFVLVTSKLFCK